MKDLRMFYSASEVAEIFGKPGPRWTYRHCQDGGFLRGAVRRFGRQILFSRVIIDRLTHDSESAP